MKTINDTQKALVQSFAKANKISHAKLDNLMNEIFNAFPKGAHKGRQMSAENVQLIESLKEYAQEHKAEKFTMKDLATKLKTDAATITNMVKKMSQEGKAFLVGQAVKAPGTRGKTPSLWSFTPAQEPSHE